MRQLWVLRGVAGCGKSTWVKNVGLEQYVVSSDAIRLLYASPVLKTDGKYTIPQTNDKKVWELLYNFLEFRMNNGDFTIVDATHCKESSLTKYKKLCEKYNYRMVIIDFSDVPLETIKERNSQREEYKQVSDEIIERMYEQIQVKLGKKYEIYSHNDLDGFSVLLHNNVELSDKYNKVVVFGDIHGCYTPLNEYFSNNPIDENTYYVFLGDYFDRGIQNKEVLQFCLDNCEKPNFSFIQGNHEIWLKNFVRDGENGKMTEAFKKSLEQFGELKNELSKFARRLKQCLTLEKNGVKYIFTHGGITNEIDVSIPTSQIIKGVGNYGDSDVVDMTFGQNTMNCYSFHGHRNIQNVPVRNTKNTFNLEGKVEFGEYLRVVEVDLEKGNPMFNVVEIKNDVYDESLVKKEFHYKNNGDILNQLDNSQLVNKKELTDGIVSYNFTRDAFYKSQWNDLTTTARGLFVDSESGDVIARSYSKFFNLEERPETQLRNLQNSLQFPVELYEKENGFLGIVSYNKKTDELFIASKSTNLGDFAGYLKEILLKTLGNKINTFKEFLKRMNVTAIFEVIDIINDPHIIEYSESKIVLLDVVKNDFSNTFMDYKDVILFAEKFGLEYKKLYTVVEDFDTLKQILEDLKSATIEGVVVKDQNGFMFKYKTPFYCYWKEMRKLKDRIVKGKDVGQVSDNVKDICEYMKTINADVLLQMSIIDVRNAYIQQIAE